MNMKPIFLSALNGNFNLGEMLNRINTHHVAGNLTDADRNELISLARSKADPFAGIDMIAKLADLEDRVRKLENEKVDPPAGGSTNNDADEYIPGKWYYKGDKVSYNGKTYVCCAPDGAVCTWNPDEYPAYWEVI